MLPGSNEFLIAESCSSYTRDTALSGSASTASLQSSRNRSTSRSPTYYVKFKKKTVITNNAQLITCTAWRSPSPMVIIRGNPCEVNLWFFVICSLLTCVTGSKPEMLFENILRFGHVKFSPCFASWSTAVEVRPPIGRLREEDWLVNSFDPESL